LLVCLLAGCDSPGGGTQRIDSGVGDPVDANVCTESTATCGQTGTPLALDESQSAQMLVGRWLGCSGQIPGLASDQAGLELTSDGHLYVLHFDAAGNLTRGRGTQYELTWQIGGVTPGVGLKITFANAGYAYYFVTFTDAPRTLQLVGMMPGMASYIPATCPETSTDGGVADLCNCGAPEGSVDPIPSLDDLQTRLVGDWILCSGAFPNLAADQAGIEFGTDGQFTVLRRNAAGNLERGLGVSHQGTWMIEGGNGWYQLNFYLAGTAVVGLFPTFESNPRRLVFDRTATLEPSCETPSDPPGGVTDVCSLPAADRCGVPDGPLDPVLSLTSLPTRLVGDWITCSGSVPGFAADQTGIEFSNDGTMTLLHRDASGNLARGQGIQYEGTWATDGSDQWYQLNISRPDGAMLQLRPGFEIDPRRLFLESFATAEPACATPGPAPGPTPNSCAGGTVAQCSLTDGPLQRYTDETAFRSLLVARWWNCSGGDVLAFAPGQAGIEFNADGTFVFIYRDASGALVRGANDNQHGTWNVSFGVPSAQLNIVTTTGGTVPVRPVFETGPSRLIIGQVLGLTSQLEFVRDCGDLVVGP
jgi:hypothetical protein